MSPLRFGRNQRSDTLCSYDMIMHYFLDNTCECSYLGRLFCQCIYATYALSSRYSIDTVNMLVSPTIRLSKNRITQCGSHTQAYTTYNTPSLPRVLSPPPLTLLPPPLLLCTAPLLGLFPTIILSRLPRRTGFLLSDRRRVGFHVVLGVGCTIPGEVAKINGSARSIYNAAGGTHNSRSFRPNMA